jgi:hypothetical protein
MAQTEQDQVGIRALLADNGTGAISPQDLRDALASQMGYASIVLSAAGQPLTVTGVNQTYALVDIFDTIASQSVDVNTNGCTATLGTDHRITFGSAGFYYVSFFASFYTDTNNELITFRPHISGAPGLIEVDRWIGTGADTGSVAMNSIVPFTAGQYLDIRIKSDVGTEDVTFKAAGLCVHRAG